MNIIFQIIGGMGKVVAATAVCKSIKVKYPDSKLIVVSGYPDVFIKNPNVDEAFNFGYVKNFYSKYIENQEILIFGHDPYIDTEHIKNKEHLIETWCRMYNLPVVTTKGEIFLTQKEIDFYSNKYASDKPIFLIQPNGGSATEKDLEYSWARDIPAPIVEEVIKQFKDNYNIVHIKKNNQKAYPFTFPVEDNIRAISVLIKLSKKRLLIDSFVQHVAAALNMPSTVLWIVNNPKVFGYDMHHNILSNPETIQGNLENSYLQKYNIIGDTLEFCYNNDREIFDTDKVIESLI